MSKALTRTDFNFPGQKSVYHGKVRDVYNINDEKLVVQPFPWVNFLCFTGS